MIECPWEEILGFRNLYEFNDFCKWLSNQIKEGMAEEIPIKVHNNFGDDFREKWFVHKESKEKWRLVLPNGPSFTGSFRSLENKDRCPWNEVVGRPGFAEGAHGFKDFSDFENFYLWLEEQVKLGNAKEVPIEKPIFCIDGEPSGEKWFMHIESRTIWRLVWPDAPAWAYFERVKKRNA